MLYLNYINLNCSGPEAEKKIQMYHMKHHWARSFPPAGWMGDKGVKNTEIVRVGDQNRLGASFYEKSVEDECVFIIICMILC